ncbi:MAG: M14 family metallopeptidase [Chloroflexota bacterium]
MKKDKLTSLMTGIWILNIFICALLAGMIGWLRNSYQSQVSSPEISPLATKNHSTLITSPTITPIPPPAQRPTITPWATPSPGPSVTPMVNPPNNRQIIGYSIEKRPQEVFKFGTGATNKLIVAGIHGGSEINTIRLADQLIAYLNDHPEHIPAEVTLFILKDINPDGTARATGVDGRVNANGVDLNHNWPYRWKADWNRDGCWNWRKVTGGLFAGSEPEIQHLIEFIDKIKPAALISYHSAALGIFPGGNPAFAPSINLARTVAEVSNYPYPPIDTGCDYSGNLTDWAANTHGIPSIDIELTNHRDTDFDQSLKVLQVFLDWK